MPSPSDEPLTRSVPCSEVDPPQKLGDGYAPEPATYDPAVDATITNSFAHAVFRFGHSRVNEATLLVDSRNQTIGLLSIRDAFFNPYRAADVGQIDEVIEPRETRPRLIRALELLRTKVQQNPPKKHGLFPV